MCRKKGPSEDNGIKFFIHLLRQRSGKLPEWSNGPHSKCGERVTVPGVRIPRFPLKRETVVGYKLATVSFFQICKDYRIDISFMVQSAKYNGILIRLSSTFRLFSEYRILYVG